MHFSAFCFFTCMPISKSCMSFRLPYDIVRSTIFISATPEDQTCVAMRAGAPTIRTAFICMANTE